MADEVVGGALDAGGAGDSAVAESTPSTPSPINLTDDSPISLDGKTTLAWKDLRSQHMLHRDYTQKTQSLAEDRRAYLAEKEAFANEQTQLRNQVSQLQGIMKNPAQLGLIIAANQAQLSQQAAEPQPVTTANIQQYIQQMQADAKAAIQEQFIEFQRAQQAQVFENEMSAHTKALVGDHPILSAFPGIDDQIWGQVASMGPKNLAEAKQMAGTVVEGLRGLLDSKLGEQAKASASAKAKVEKGIEPKGGAPVMPKRKDAKKLADLDNDMLAHNWGGD